jgi:hypothetical protein
MDWRPAVLLSSSAIDIATQNKSKDVFQPLNGPVMLQRKILLHRRAEMLVIAIGFVLSALALWIMGAIEG